MPRKLRLSLRARVLLSMLGVMAVAIAGFYYAVARFVEVLEHELLDTTLQEAMDRFVDDYHRDPAAVPAVDPDFRGFVATPAQIPALPRKLRGMRLGRGMHLVLDGIEYEAERRDVGDVRLFVLYDVATVEALEARLIRIAWAVGLIALVVAALTALWLSARFTRPVTRLAGEVATLDPARPSQRIAFQNAEDEVGVIAEAFNRYLDRLEAFVARERSFTEDASHELRTPITTVQTSVQLLVADAGLTPTTRERVLRIQRAAEQMGLLIEALLFLSREDGGAIPTPCALDEIVRDAAAQFADLAAAKSVILEARIVPGPTVMAPAGMAQCVVNNLLVNAVHFTQRGRIDVHLAGGCLTVEDTGVGIPPEDLSRVFERRFRGSHSRGLGLGLYLVKRICDHLGWTISVSSVPGAGTRFELRFVR